jgi:hypothetical protein
MSRWPLIRDLLLFWFGIAGAVYETVLHPPPSSTALIFFSACIGLPAFLPDGIKIIRKDQDK